MVQFPYHFWQVISIQYGPPEVVICCLNENIIYLIRVISFEIT